MTTSERSALSYRAVNASKSFKFTRPCADVSADSERSATAPPSGDMRALAVNLCCECGAEHQRVLAQGIPASM